MLCAFYTNCKLTATISGVNRNDIGSTFLSGRAWFLWEQTDGSLFKLHYIIIVPFYYRYIIKLYTCYRDIDYNTCYVTLKSGMQAPI